MSKMNVINTFLHVSGKLIVKSQSTAAIIEYRKVKSTIRQKNINRHITTHVIRRSSTVP